MTMQQKEEIYNKDVLSIADVQVLTGFGYDTAAEIIRDIKVAMKSKFKRNGYVATADYKRYMGVTL